MFPKLSNLLLFSFIGFVDVHKIEFGFIFSVSKNIRTTSSLLAMNTPISDKLSQARQEVSISSIRRITGNSEFSRGRAMMVHRSPVGFFLLPGMTLCVYSVHHLD